MEEDEELPWRCEECELKLRARSVPLLGRPLGGLCRGKVLSGVAPERPSCSPRAAQLADEALMSRSSSVKEPPSRHTEGPPLYHAHEMRQSVTSSPNKLPALLADTDAALSGQGHSDPTPVPNPQRASVGAAAMAVNAARIAVAAKVASAATVPKAASSLSCLWSGDVVEGRAALTHDEAGEILGRGGMRLEELRSRCRGVAISLTNQGSGSKSFKPTRELCVRGGRADVEEVATLLWSQTRIALRLPPRKPSPTSVSERQERHPRPRSQLASVFIMSASHSQKAAAASAMEHHDGLQALLRGVTTTPSASVCRPSGSSLLSASHGSFMSPDDAPAAHGWCRRSQTATKTAPVASKMIAKRKGRSGKSGRLAWSAREEADLRRGVAKHGKGEWQHILDDPDFAFHSKRDGVALKDKWRNMSK